MFDLRFSHNTHCRYISLHRTSSLSFITTLYSIVCINHNFLCQSPVGDQLGNFQFFSSTNSTVRIYNFNRYPFPNKGLSCKITRSDIASSEGTCVYVFLWILPNCPPRSCMIYPCFIYI